MMRNPKPAKLDKPQLIVALDVGTLEEAEHLVGILLPAVKIFKVGSQLFTGFGPEAVRRVSKKGARVFLDLKSYDIPNTVYQTASMGTLMAYMITSEVAAGLGKVVDATALAVFMMTTHIEGGREMLEAAVRGATEKAKELNVNRPFIVGVTRLTSDKQEDNTKQEVLESARLAKDAGLDGVVCSVREAQSVREECGDDFLIVTPGIRSGGYPSDDQSRVATAKEALEAGADFIVVGRPIIKAGDPLRVAKAIVNEISSQ
jgi:orotidine-5'-phosphate decarboxylase